MSHPPSTRTLVTGAGRGLGLEFVRQCAARGDRVYAGVRNPQAADQLDAIAKQHAGRVFVFPLDVTNADSIAHARKTVGDKTEWLDLLINNAGINSRSADLADHQRNTKLGSLEASGLLRMIEVNAIAPILLTQQFLDLLESGNRPRVINISSWLGSIDKKVTGGNYGYCASKATLNMLGRTLAFDLKERGIITLMFNPGWVRTDMGGAKAELTPTQSVCGILGTSDTASLDDSGSFFQIDGTSHPW